MANLERREKKNGVIVYKVSVFLGRDANGKIIKKCDTYTPEQHWSVAKQEKEALKYALAFEEKVKNGGIVSGDKLTVAEYCTKWLEDSKETLAPTTYEYYSEFINKKLIPAIGYQKMSNVKAGTLKDFMNNLRGAKGQELKPSSKKKDLAIIKSIFKTAWRDEIICNNPAERLKAPKQDYEEGVECFNAEQARIFLNVLKDGFEYTYGERHRVDKQGNIYIVRPYIQRHEIPMQLRVFYCIALFSGARKGEILGLCWDDIDFERCVITVNKNIAYLYTEKKVITKQPKTKKSIREIHLPESLMNLIREYKLQWLRYKLEMGSAWQGEKDFLFIQQNGKVMHPSTPYHSYMKILKRYNETVEDESKKLPLIKLHGLRHTTASLLIANHVDVLTVSKRLGHSNHAVTLNVYSHAFMELDVVASDTLENLMQEENRINKGKAI